MYLVFFLLCFVSLIALIIGLIKPALVVRWGEEKTRKKVIKVFGAAAVVLFILTGLTTPELTPEEKAAMAQKKEEARAAKDAKKAEEARVKEVVKVAQKNEEAKQEPAQSKDVFSQTKTFIDTDLNRLTSYVSTNADTTWQNNFTEPVTLLAQGKKDSPSFFSSNMEIGIFVYKGVIKEIDNFEVPGYLSDEDAKLVNTVIDGLRQSIAKRVEVMELLHKAMEPVLSAKNNDEIIKHLNNAIELIESDDIANRMILSSSALYGAVNAYGTLLKKYE